MTSMSIPDARPPHDHADDRDHMEALEALADCAYGASGSVTEVIRPAAVLPENAARSVLFELTMRDARSGGEWIALPTSWSLYDRPWAEGSTVPGDAELIGTMHVTYGTPTRYEITIFRATVTAYGTMCGWDVVRLCDEALGHAGLSLESCPRAQLTPPPRPFRMG